MDQFDDKWARRQEHWARRQERWAHRHERWAGRHTPQHAVFIGAIIIAIGTFWLLDNLGVFYIRDYWAYWPVILIALGLAKIAEARGSGALISGGILAGVGALILLQNLNLFDFNWHRYWPVILIAWGVLILLRPSHWHAPWYHQGAPGVDPASASSSSTVSLVTVFGGGRRQNDSHDFRGGEINAIFGGYELDLRQAAITADVAVLDVNAIFGGVEIQVPYAWVVEAKGVGIFGGFGDQTVPPNPDPAVKPQRLIVTGSAIFGGVNIRN